MTIDAKELREAIDAYREVYTGRSKNMQISLVLDAAEAHLATLPREVEVDGWVLVWPDGKRGAFIYNSEHDALHHADVGQTAVRLTGTATIKGNAP